MSLEQRIRGLALAGILGLATITVGLQYDASSTLPTPTMYSPSPTVTYSPTSTRLPPTSARPTRRPTHTPQSTSTPTATPSPTPYVLTADAFVEQFLDDVNEYPPFDEPIDHPKESLEYGLVFGTDFGTVDDAGWWALVYRVQQVNKMLANNEFTLDTMPRQYRNLYELGQGIIYHEGVQPIDQLGQPDYVREEVLSRIVASQAHMTPLEALASNTVIGLMANRSDEDRGRKFLLYAVPRPNATPQWRGVIMNVDVASMVDLIGTDQATREHGLDTFSYNYIGWNLPWGGDLAMRDWSQIPPGLTKDPYNVDEGRPGILLISEEVFYDYFTP